MVALSTYLPLAAAPTPSCSARRPAAQPVFMAHGTQDPVVPFAAGAAQRRAAARSSASPSSGTRYPMPHRSAPRRSRDLGDWMSMRASRPAACRGRRTRARTARPWLPDLCRLPRLATMLGVAELVVLVIALAPDRAARPGRSTRFVSASGFALWLALTVSVLLCVSRRRLSRLPTRLGAAASLARCSAALIAALGAAMLYADRRQPRLRPGAAGVSVRASSAAAPRSPR